MLGNAKVSAVIPVTNMERARDFYEGILDLEVLNPSTPQGSVLYNCNGTHLLVYERATASSGEHTIAGFEVGDDFDEIIDGLLARGITFDTFEVPGVDMPWDDRGVLLDEENASAWFKDPDGNVLAIGRFM